MDTPTHYELLCVAPEATADDIRAAYRRLIRVYHPDVVGASGEAMTLRLNAAQHELLDPVLRARYDRARRSHAATPPVPDRPTEPRFAADQPFSRDRPFGNERPRPRTTPPHTAPSRRWSPLAYRAWLATMLASVAVIVASTAIVFAYSYSGPLTLTSPRVIPPLVIALAWLVGGLARPARIFVALLALGAALWPLTVFGPFSLIGDLIPSGVLALLTVSGVAAVTLRLSAPRAIALIRARPVGRTATA
jgi:hypothetical protein